MCHKSESIKNIAVALAKFNGEVSKIEKDSSNPHFRNKYASLDNIIDEIRPILTKHGLSIIQMPGGDGETFSMTTMLLHESGEWIESQPIVMRPVKNDPQGIGSCATYARRYSLAAFLSLNTGEDDDGNGASQTPYQSRQPSGQGERTNQPPASPTSQPAATKALNNKSHVMALMNEMKWDWNALGSFASDVLGRKIGKVLQDIKTEDEWKKVAEQMEISRAAAIV